MKSTPSGERSYPIKLKNLKSEGFLLAANLFHELLQDKRSFNLVGAHFALDLYPKIHIHTPLKMESTNAPFNLQGIPKFSEALT